MGNSSGAGPGARPQKFWRARHRRYASNRSNARSRAPLEKVGWLLPPVNERISSACSSSTTKSDASVSEDCSISTIEKGRDRSADYLHPTGKTSHSQLSSDSVVSSLTTIPLGNNKGCP